MADTVVRVCTPPPYRIASVTCNSFLIIDGSVDYQKEFIFLCRLQQTQYLRQYVSSFFSGVRYCNRLLESNLQFSQGPTSAVTAAATATSAADGSGRFTTQEHARYWFTRFATPCEYRNCQLAFSQRGTTNSHEQVFTGTTIHLR